MTIKPSVSSDRIILVAMGLGALFDVFVEDKSIHGAATKSIENWIDGGGNLG
jgi:hypothetical protein